MKVSNIYSYNWYLYKLYCYRNGLTEGQFKNFKKYMEVQYEY
ncbi:MAG: hypothetical protein RSF67_08940 [Clostridia bacterium]